MVIELVGGGELLLAMTGALLWAWSLRREVNRRRKAEQELLAARDELKLQMGCINRRSRVGVEESLQQAVALLTREVEEKERIQEALNRENGTLYGILDAMDDGVYIVDRECNIEYVNPVVERTFGSPAGLKCHRYFHDRQEPCPWCKNQQVFAGQTVNWAWTSPKTGQSFDLFDAPLCHPDGHVSKIGFFHDVTEHKRRVNQNRAAASSSPCRHSGLNPLPCNPCRRKPLPLPGTGGCASCWRRIPRTTSCCSRSICQRPPTP
ncbi:MAG: PAS domain-containing protein [Magnetococcales bacterium]|nr:PAS domain-containing protein [Magnetococcales bacterium]